MADLRLLNLDRCTHCDHPRAEHAYSDDHARSDWMNDDGSINYATHCHHQVDDGFSCRCPDVDGRGRPRAEGWKECLP